ncbi:MAG: DNA-3-methyladenine glycosylase 2 family protein [Gammaproteobacteria bacterium]|nr:DNA-3-methyladenine glycosylase 2 family protein [Gammaproteobacteria bacterium]
MSTTAAAERSEQCVLRLPLKTPFNAPLLFSFLEGRALAGLEAVGGSRYRRRLGPDAWLEARVEGDSLNVSVPPHLSRRTDEIVKRLTGLFDLDVDPGTIDSHLARHPALARRVQAAPGIRVPGTWDPFEGAVRAILGQQVSVARATTLAGLLSDRFGDGGFPDAPTLAEVDVAEIGLPRMRGRAVSAVAARVAREGVDWLEDGERLRAGLLEIPGIGPWTAEYAAMRIARDPDAFPDTDWGVVKALGVKGAAAREWAEPLRPWRAYAVMHLWRKE